MASKFAQYQNMQAPPQQYQAPREPKRDTGGGLLRLFTTELKWNSPFIIIGMIVAFVLFIVAFMMLLNRTVGVEEFKVVRRVD